MIQDKLVIISTNKDNTLNVTVGNLHVIITLKTANDLVQALSNSINTMAVEKPVSSYPHA